MAAIPPTAAASRVVVAVMDRPVIRVHRYSTTPGLHGVAMRAIFAVRSWWLEEMPLMSRVFALMTRFPALTFWVLLYAAIVVVSFYRRRRTSPKAIPAAQADEIAKLEIDTTGHSHSAALPTCGDAASASHDGRDPVIHHQSDPGHACIVTQGVAGLEPSPLKAAATTADEDDTHFEALLASFCNEETTEGPHRRKPESPAAAKITRGHHPS